MFEYGSSPADRARVAASLRELSAASRDVTDALSASAPSGVLAADSGREINAASRLVLLHQAVATDHLSSFATLLESPGSHGPSLATIERSMLETWARAWWLLSASTPAQAEYRARAMVVRELEAGAERGIQLLSAESIYDAITRATAERDAIDTEPRDRVPGPTMLVRTLLSDTVATDSDAAAIYSHLSGIAHGESVFTASLTLPETSSQAPTIALPSDNLAKYSQTILGVAFQFTQKVLVAWGVHESHLRHFAGTVARVAAELQ